MKPFLLLATRSEDAAADAEHAALLQLGGLSNDQLHRIRLESQPMPPIDLEDYSGVILGGSPFTSSIPDEHKSDTQRRVEKELAGLLDVLVAHDFPFLGACYGIGTLARQIGGVVDSTYGEEVSAPTITLSDAGRNDPLLASLPAEFQAFVGHKEACTSLPVRAVVLASSADCPVQMFRVGSNVYATQFHPELDLPGLVKRMEIYQHAGYFAPDEFDTILQHVSQANVSVVGRIVTNFVARFAR